jgi:predicted ATPase with chaperone activity
LNNTYPQPLRGHGTFSTPSRILGKQDVTAHAALELRQTLGIVSASGQLPPMNDAEAMEVATLRSIVGRPLKPSEWRSRPFRSPHHTASAAALVGGGVHPRPGEISLAHNGVLFLDELPEFERRVLEVLREPLEAGAITISRAARQAVERYCAPNAAGLAILERAMQHLGLSARGYHRVLKVARTIADMSGKSQIEAAQITEALALRSLDRPQAMLAKG